VPTGGEKIHNKDSCSWRRGEREAESGYYVIRFVFSCFSKCILLKSLISIAFLFGVCFVCFHRFGMKTETTDRTEVDMNNTDKRDKIISVLIAEDEELIRKAFCLLVQSLEGVELAGEAENGARAIELAIQLQPDIVLMDLAMPVMNGIEAVIGIRKKCPGTRVIALTGLRDPAEIMQGITEGMNGFLLKRTSPAELKQALEAVARGERYLSPEVESIVARQYVEERLRKESPLAELSGREVQIIELLATGKRAKNIADVLGISSKTVEKHLENARRKMSVSTSPELIATWQRLRGGGEASG
jgi:two-component system, NarL family, response regulator NreC